MNIVWNRRATIDLDNVFQTIANDDPRAAIKVLDSIESGVEHLAKHPMMGRRGRVETTRELIVPGSPFIVVYRILEPALEIVAILHTSRKWPDKL